MKRKKQPKQTIKIGSGSLIVVLLVLLVVFLLIGERQWFQSSSSQTYNSSKVVKRVNVTRLNEEYQTVDDILQWICMKVKSKELKIVDLTNWGPSSLVILHKLEQLQRIQGCPTIPVVTIDTLHLFPESYTFLESKKKIMGQNLLIVKPKKYETAKGFDNHYGINLAVEHPQQYAYWSKVEPMYRAFNALKADAWITGRRRSQGGERTNLQAFELDSNNNKNKNNKIKRLKINPLVDWTYEQVWEYIRDNDIPYNPLYDQGYKSLGDVRTTNKVDEQENERAGRFQGMNQTECGIHNLAMLSSSAEEEMKPIEVQTYMELARDTLDRVVLNEETNQYRNGRDNVFVVFYHPQCGHCQRFEPAFFQLANEMYEAPESALLHKTIATRFNIGRYHTPNAKLKAVGMEVQGTPAIFLVKHKPTRHAVEYKGPRNRLPILLWLRKELGGKDEHDGEELSRKNSTSTTDEQDDQDFQKKTKHKHR
ncbi:unnamed protein product [Cylindrotheca closterium]|uniref:Thioredoxin domain-containing protein n=1 Tax=Cylindrotheca closterium TaxID=2856 RepID=A0AAD2FYF4_9STRA|nr:unnamed protein product [Cylindrotheca closterium]